MRIALALALLPITAFAVTQVPEVDPVATLIDLVKNWEVYAPLVKAAAIIAVIVQAVKTFMPSFPYSRLILASVGLVYGVIDAVITGRSFFDALVFVFITSGGAMILYDVLKNPVAVATMLIKK